MAVGGRSGGPTMKTTAATWLLIGTTLWLGICVDGTHADGNIGCLFFDELCGGQEWCYDDFIFGKCLLKFGYTDADLDRRPLAEPQLHVLLSMLQELRGAGLGWDDEFVQCRMQTTLRALLEPLADRSPQDQCAHLVPGAGGSSDLYLDAAAAAAAADPNGRMAFVRFVPPQKEGQAQRVAERNDFEKANDNNGDSAELSAYADELYSPPQELPMMSLNAQQQSAHLRGFGQPMDKRQPAQLQFGRMRNNGNINENHAADDDGAAEADEFLLNAAAEEQEALAEQMQDMRNRIELRRMLAEYEAGELPEPVYRTYAQQMEQQLLLPAQTQQQHQQQQQRYANEYNMEAALAALAATKRNHHRQQLPQRDGDDDADYAKYEVLQAENQFDEQRRPATTAFREVAARQHTIPKAVIDSAALSRSAELTNELPIERMVLSVTGDEQQQGQRLGNEFLAGQRAQQQQQQQPHRLTPQGGVYTEGGLVYVPNSNEQRQAEQYVKQMEAADLLNSMLGFTRHERLDVKKPGPLVKPDDAEQPVPQPQNQQNAGEKSKEGDAKTKEATGTVESKGLQGLFTPKMKKIIHPLNDHGPHSVDTEYAYVIMRAPIENWSDGPRLVAAIAETLNMKNYLTFSRVDRHEISFRVEENPQRRSAADIARSINESRTKNNLLRRYGYSVVIAGVGDKTKVPLSVSVIRAERNQPDVTYILTYILLGAGAAALMVIIVAVIFVRRSERKRDKLGGLQAGLTSMETNSKDYQDLCRNRMAGKAQGATGGPGVGGEGRIFGQSAKEVNEKQQSSSRSSVSSWSEEPGTNMDISTGHMVLSYMEDHLKNKGRLQREWEALCRYEAEPSSRDAASKPECAALNRPTAPLPYDHSRVLINHLANTDGLDYINASSITDHDPRSAAYIAAQGPLPSTLAHFWQMVWEQGSIMIVMLCRLQENGAISCARYWPEEGSEVYDIYEVHLVSEHTTCDDYLVRSFYLKNLRTGETRTVTQFHFLSWSAFGLPAAARTLLEFRRKVNKSFRGRASPVIVHSSNGAGRTGSYILLDMVLGRMHKGAREIDIAATLEHLRDQRAGLVATQQQFEFVLMAVAEEVHAILKALPANAQAAKGSSDLDCEAVREGGEAGDETKKLIDVSEETTGGGSGDVDKDAGKEKTLQKRK